MSEFTLLIGGKSVPGDSEMPIVNPATEEVFAASPRASERQFNEAVAAAKAAFPAWSRTTIEERRAALNKMADVIDAHLEELARLVTLEQGKPLDLAKGETGGASYYTRYFASLSFPTERIGEAEGRDVQLHRRPLGVVAAIIPWNFPLALFSMKVPPALLAGNTVVVKPAPTTPLSTLRLAELCKDIFPPGVLNVVVDNNDLGHVLTGHPDIRKVSFTGSTATGKKVMASAASSVKRVTLELGGNDAAIVLDDAKPREMAPAIFGAAFANAGQVCLAIKRLYVHASIYDEMCDELVRIANGTVVDDGLKQGTQMGPLQNKMQYEKIKDILASLGEDGKIAAGGSALDRPGYFIAPTIVRDIKEGTRLVDEEQFGPVLPVIKYNDVDEVIARANNSEYGLGASVWSSDKKRAQEVAARVEAGTVWINKHLDSPADVPFGGAKQSGMGVEFGLQGLAEFTQLQVISAA